MSDFNNDPRRDPMADPLNPAVTPPGTAYDKYGNARFEPVREGGNGPLVLLGILAAIGIIGGLLYFNHTPADRNQQQAQAPVTRTMTPTTSPAAPGAPALTPSTDPSAPAATPSPATPPAAPAGSADQK